MDPVLGLLATLVVVVPVLYMYTVSVVQSRFPALNNKRICLLIAHPDDEAMFFAPTVLALTRPETGNHVKILCLSTGNADGLGETRKKELVKSGMHLGLRDEDDVFVVDNPTDFPDSMTTKWDENRIATLLCSAFAPQLGRQRSDDSAKPTANIDVLITFDGSGVSSHPNHISLYHGARAFVAGLMRGKSGWTCPVDLYTLSTVNVVRKYSAFLDVFATMASWAIGVRHEDKAHPGGLVFMSQLIGEGGLPTAMGAMTQAHKSQMVWFRYFYIAFSRYMVINDLRLEKVKSK
ncbi:N-acetylglucosaminyl-phosphatidylinositol de-N-acetylase [Pochonia chlamydosporia 170]|uniref:N-acetylglucosaminylphosphatidylinositol deacetylase n=1 Tax=Pochonia chlamydosporia 170 TaxID=1380566 RepID=A0A179FME1_METCM|nr:N-acetylglucosaminyl-phosphatidylinositol de-N-acetylase [Pochonia chlamydosporia 170]OAQ66752.1 N-acetylglucosaminyl-phosphatidylinositol de-N-acetylase [Pochonia chlamydosporia 170]